MEVEKVTVGQINSNQFYKSIIVQGMITHIEEIKPKLIKGAFKCQMCGEITTIEQDDSGKLIEPYECLNDVCGRKKSFKLLHEESIWMDERQFILRDVEFSDREITVIVRGMDLINTIGEVSARSDVTGTIHVTEEKKGFERILLATNIENRPFEIIENPSNTADLREKIKIIRGIVKELQQPKQGERSGAASIKDIISRAEKIGIGKKQVEYFIERLKSAGELIESSNEKFRVV